MGSGNAGEVLVPGQFVVGSILTVPGRTPLCESGGWGDPCRLRCQLAFSWGQPAGSTLRRLEGERKGEVRVPLLLLLPLTGSGGRGCGSSSCRRDPLRFQLPRVPSAPGSGDTASSFCPSSLGSTFLLSVTSRLHHSPLAGLSALLPRVLVWVLWRKRTNNRMRARLHLCAHARRALHRVAPFRSTTEQVPSQWWSRKIIAGLKCFPWLVMP